MHASTPLSRRTELLILAGVFLAGAILRFWALGAKGLAYDEAATALMARAAPDAIVAFHWDAAFEHPPLWQLTMHAWSRFFGQSETALRILPAVAGSFAVLLTWYWLRLLWPARAALRLLSSALVATSPVLILYSQEARMYTIVVLLALLSLIAAVDLVREPGWSAALLFVLANWLLVGYHYYALMLVGTETLFFLMLALRRQSWRAAGWWGGAIVLSVAPIFAWMAFAPGFRETFAVITGGIGKSDAPPAWLFFDGLWRDLSFGGIRWQPPYAVWGYVLAPLIVAGAISLIGADRSEQARIPWSWLVVLIVALPLAVSVVLFRSLAARYILFITPALYGLAAAAILWLWRRHWALGGVAAAAAGALALAGLIYYFGPYHKSEYREMAAFLETKRGDEDAVMLYAPRQHLLAKYYLPEDWRYATGPQIDLPPYWPVTAPRVVPEEMDGQVQELLRTHPSLWLVMTAQDEVDPGEFVPKYLNAVAYKQDCWSWLDVELCRFLSPRTFSPDQTASPGTLYNGELRLQRTATQLLDDPQLGRRYLLAQLDWLANQKPTIDYRVTVRMLDSAGAVIAQRDDFPIGNLLPPTTWNAGDAKPGYIALPLPDQMPAGDYKFVVGVYDPRTGVPIEQPVVVGNYAIAAGSGAK